MKRNSKLTLQRETYVHKIVQLVEEQILSGLIPAEAKISEGQLAKEFGVSRGPAREALNRLEVRDWLKKKISGEALNDSISMSTGKPMN